MEPTRIVGRSGGEMEEGEDGVVVAVVVMMMTMDGMTPHRHTQVHNTDGDKRPTSSLHLLQHLARRETTVEEVIGNPTF